MITKESGLTILCSSIGHECDWGECEQGFYGVNGVCACGWCMYGKASWCRGSQILWMDGWPWVVGRMV